MVCPLHSLGEACMRSTSAQVWLHCRQGTSLQALPRGEHHLAQEHMDAMLSSPILPGLLGLETMPVYAVATDGRTGFFLLPPEVSRSTVWSWL